MGIAIQINTNQPVGIPRSGTILYLAKRKAQSKNNGKNLDEQDTRRKKERYEGKKKERRQDKINCQKVIYL